jgi:hypothetical protein
MIIIMIMIIIIITILVITFMQGIYNYIPETNHISRVYSVGYIVFCIYSFVLHVTLEVSHPCCVDLIIIRKYILTIWSEHNYIFVF